MANKTKKGDESELVTWLKQNDFKQVVPIFKEADISFSELISMGENIKFLRQYLNDLNIPKSFITRIEFKITKMLESIKDDKNDNDEDEKENISSKQQKVLRIIMSQKEDEAIKKLKDYTNKISLTMKHLMTENNALIENEKKLKSEINAEFNNLINLISIKQEEMLNNLKNITQKNQSTITAKSQDLQQRQELTQNAIKSCENMLEGSNMDLNDREQKIVSMTNDILRKRVEYYRADAIKFKFNKHAVTSVNSLFCI